MRAPELAAQTVAEFVEAFGLPRGRSVLDVGCGRGELARVLRSRGYRVSAIDRDGAVVAEARRAGLDVEERDFFDYRGHRFDMVTFSRSLHELGDPAGALEHAEGLMEPDGLLIVDEFARDRADGATAAFFYDTCALLDAADVLHAPESTGESDPLERWERQYGRRRPGADRIVAAIRDRFDVLEVRSGAYLYRHIGQWLEDSDRGSAVLARLREVEEGRVASGDLAAMGVFVAARSRDRPIVR